MLERAKRASHIDPPASSYAIMRRARPYRGENPEPGKDVHGEPDPWPGIREQPRSVATEPFSARPDLCLLLPQERPFGAWVWKVAKGQEQTFSGRLEASAGRVNRRARWYGAGAHCALKCEFQSYFWSRCQAPSQSSDLPSGRHRIWVTAFANVIGSLSNAQRSTQPPDAMRLHDLFRKRLQDQSRALAGPTF